MFLLHPPIAPWLQRHADGCSVTLLCDREQGLTVFLRAEPDNEEMLIPMRCIGQSGALWQFVAELPWDGGNVNTRYAFKIVHDGSQTWLAADGQHRWMPPLEVHFRVCREHQPPAWVAGQVFYQIFPDRFCQGDPNLGVQSGEYVYGSGHWPVVRKPWGAPIDRSLPVTEFFGGDLPGITQQLDYLQQELGITALYLNPIFTSGSNHRYDTEDYYQVDPHLGGNTALEQLCQAVHGRGMKIVLDAVVNHTSFNHPWFNRFGRHDTHGAWQSSASPWRNWYTFGTDGSYCSWKGHSSLPVLDMGNPAVQQQIYAGEQAVLRHWLRGPWYIDGWRFDVLHMLGEGPGARNNAHYVAEFRRALREENPQAYVMGEHFFEATRWLQGDQEDGAMNYYGFAHPVRAWLADKDVAYQPLRISTAEFEQWLTSARARVPWDNQLAQLNLIDSHDTARFLTLLGGDVQRMQLAATLLLTYPGTPCIYYGDEIGMHGGTDPDCRQCFDWQRERWNLELFHHYRELIQMRKRRPELQHGAWQTLAVSEQALVFARYNATHITVVGVNRGDQAVELELPLQQLPLPVQRWSTGTAPTRLHLPACGSCVVHGEV